MKKLSDLGTYRKNFDPAIGITLKFVLIGILWIIFSDSLLTTLSADFAFLRLSQIHILKGIAFVGVTGAFIFSVLHNFVSAAKVKDSELLHFFRLNPNAMAIVDGSTFQFLDVNEAALKLFGRSQDEMVLLKLGDLVAPHETNKFRSVLLFIKTGFENLDSWSFIKTDDTVFSLEISARPLSNTKRYLVCFRDVTKQLKVEETSLDLEAQIARRTHHFERMNEELAYRASQTEHVNTELILVNEQLLNVNKRIAGELSHIREEAQRKDQICQQFGIHLFVFDLKDEKQFYVSSGASTFLEVSPHDINHALFWLDHIHEEEVNSIERNYQQLPANTSWSFSCRILTQGGIIKPVQVCLRKTVTAQSEFLSGCLMELVTAQTDLKVSKSI